MALFGKLPGKRLRDAASEGNLDEVHRIIDKGVDINDRSASTGATALFEAVAHGHISVLTALLESGADANIPDLWEETPLTVAAGKGASKMVNTLTSSRDFKRLSKQKVYAAFLAACKGGHTETAQLFIPLGVDINYNNPQDDAGSALHVAARRGHAGTVQALIESGAKVNQRKIRTSWNMDGTVRITQGGTALHEASQHGHTEVVKVLLHKGADSSIADEAGKTAGMLVCSKYKGKVDQKKVTTDIQSLLTLGNTLNSKLFGQMPFGHQQKKFSAPKEVEAAADNVIRALDTTTTNNNNKNISPPRKQSKQEGSKPPAPPQILVPRSSVTLPKDKVKQLCAAGGYGEVVEGEKAKDKVSVKLFNYKLLGMVDEKEAVKEALQLQAANSPNVCRCLGILEDSSTDVGSCLQGSLVMEWAEGGSLYHWLQGEGATAEMKERLSVAMQLASGMKHLHELSIVHGDLRPQNVVVKAGKAGQGPQVKVAGYGLSFHNSCSMMAPNQARQPGCLEHRSPERLTDTFQGSVPDDVYAFGILMYFIVTSLPPFPRIRADELERAVCRGLRPAMKDWALAQPAGVQQQVATAYLKLAESCWQQSWWSRPQFGAVLSRLQGMLMLVK